MTNLLVNKSYTLTCSKDGNDVTETIYIIVTPTIYTYAQLDSNPAKYGTKLTMDGDYYGFVNTYSAWNTARTNISKTTGKWYIETQIRGTQADSSYMIGICNPTYNNWGTTSHGYVGQTNTGIGVRSYGANDQRFYNGGNINIVGLFPAGTVSQGDIYMMKIDLDSDSVSYGVNGVWGSVPMDMTPSDLAGNVHLCFSSYGSGGGYNINLGQEAFTYSVPSGYNAGWYE